MHVLLVIMLAALAAACGYAAAEAIEFKALWRAAMGLFAVGFAVSAALLVRRCALEWVERWPRRRQR